MATHLSAEAFGSREPAGAGVAALLGVEEGAIRWEHALLFFAALFSEALARFLLIRWIAGSGWDMVGAFLFERLYSEAALAVLAVLVLRFVRRPGAAIATLSVIYALLETAISRASTDASSQGGLGGVLVAQAVSAMVFVAVMFGALELGMRRYRRLAPVFFLASFMASIASLLLRLGVVDPLLLDTEGPGMKWLLMRLPVSLAGAVVFAAVLWGGLRLARAAPFHGSARPQRLSRSFFAGSLYALFGVALLSLLTVAAILSSDAARLPSMRAAVATGPTAAYILLVAVGAVIFLVFIYRMWAAIQAEGARTTPGKAVGLLFVPIFNVYWAFQVFGGFAADVNRIAARRGLAPTLPVALFAAYPAASFLAAVPRLGVFLTPIAVALMLVVVVKAADAVNAIGEAPATGGAASGPGG